MRTWNQQTIVGIQLLRAIAALSVVYLHCAANARHVPVSGSFGVDIFFVISGFVIAYVVSRSGDTEKFLAKRIIRIEPMYFLATLTMVLAVTYFPGVIKSTELSLSGFVKSILFVPGPENMARPILPQGWSLNYEMFFYVVMYLCILFVKNKKYLTTACVSTIVAVIAVLFFVDTKSFILNYYETSRFLEFIYGIALYHAYTLYEKNQHLIIINRYVKTVTLTTLMVLCYGFLFYCEMNGIQWLSRGICFGIPSLLLVSAVLFFENEIKRHYNIVLHFFVELGEASYVMYLIHHHVVVFFSRAVFDKVIKTNGALIYEIIKIIITVVLTIAVSLLVHIFIDTPIQRYLKRVVLGKQKNEAA